MPNGVFGKKLAKTGVKQKKEHQCRILHIPNSLGTKFQLKLTILDFWTALIQKGYFQTKKE